jgi:hypothetical protein
MTTIALILAIWLLLNAICVVALVPVKGKKRA